MLLLKARFFIFIIFNIYNCYDENKEIVKILLSAGADVTLESEVFFFIFLFFYFFVIVLMNNL